MCNNATVAFRFWNFFGNGCSRNLTEYACTRNKLPSMHAFAICMCTHVRGFVSCACKFSRIIAWARKSAHILNHLALAQAITLFAWGAVSRAWRAAQKILFHVWRSGSRSALFWWIRSQLWCAAKATMGRPRCFDCRRKFMWLTPEKRPGVAFVITVEIGSRT